MPAPEPTGRSSSASQRATRSQIRRQPLTSSVLRRIAVIDVYTAKTVKHTGAVSKVGADYFTLVSQTRDRHEPVRRIRYDAVQAWAVVQMRAHASPPPIPATRDATGKR